MATDPLDSRSFDSADETRRPPNCTVEVVNIGDHSIGRMTMQPGWTWADSVKPSAGTDHCEKLHVGYTVSGTLETWLPDGTRATLHPGEAYVIPPGHDAKVVGDEPWVGVEFSSADTYAKR